MTRTEKRLCAALEKVSVVWTGLSQHSLKLKPNLEQSPNSLHRLRGEKMQKKQLEQTKAAS